MTAWAALFFFVWGVMIGICVTAVVLTFVNPSRGRRRRH